MNFFFQNWEIVNSAILTGKQVSQGMKVVMVSHGGHLADVTLQASCHVPDDSVIKVCFLPFEFLIDIPNIHLLGSD